MKKLTLGKVLGTAGAILPFAAGIPGVSGAIASMFGKGMTASALGGLLGLAGGGQTMFGGGDSAGGMFGQGSRFLGSAGNQIMQMLGRGQGVLDGPLSDLLNYANNYDYSGDVDRYLGQIEPVIAKQYAEGTANSLMGLTDRGVGLSDSLAGDVASKGMSGALTAMQLERARARMEIPNRRIASIGSAAQLFQNYMNSMMGGAQGLGGIGQGFGYLGQGGLMLDNQNFLRQQGMAEDLATILSRGRTGETGGGLLTGVNTGGGGNDYLGGDTLDYRRAIEQANRNRFRGWGA